MIFIVTGFIFLIYGAASMIYVPSETHEGNVLDERRAERRRRRLEQAADIDEAEEDLYEEDKFEREENVNIRNGLNWKRRHFFVICVFVAIFLMIKLEFSYKKIFS